MIEIVNPNSSASVTSAIAEACSASALPPGLWTVGQIDAAPPAIESDDDVVRATELVTEHVRASNAGCVVVACHSDPGVREARAALPGRDILGIGETSMLVAASLGERFGVISLFGPAIPRKRRMVERLGLASRCASVVATGTGVLDGVGDPDLGPYLGAAERAVAEGADVLVLGCAGMVRLPALIEEHVRVPVVEPVVATLAVAISRVRRQDRRQDRNDGA